MSRRAASSAATPAPTGGWDTSTPLADMKPDRAILMDGPLVPEARIRLARIEETDGSKEKAIELYKQYLTDEPDGSAAPLARTRLVAMGVQPPTSPNQMTLPLGGGAGSPIQIQ